MREKIIMQPPFGLCFSSAKFIFRTWDHLRLKQLELGSPKMASYLTLEHMGGRYLTLKAKSPQNDFFRFWPRPIILPPALWSQTPLVPRLQVPLGDLREAVGRALAFASALAPRGAWRRVRLHTPQEHQAAGGWPKKWGAAGTGGAVCGAY